MRRIFYTICIIWSVKGTAQDLVANGTLDERNTCTEFKALCAPEAWFFLPRYVAPSLTTDSIHYCEALCVGNLVRGFWSINYLYTKVLCPLEKGKKYRFGIWINCGRNDFDHLDVWMGAEEPRIKQMSQYLNKASFTITPADADSIVGSWRKYNYVFTARGDERFIMFGNLTEGEVDRSKVYFSNRNGNIYYYVDNITLRPLKKSAKVCSQYYAVLKQVYDQDKRHPARLIEEVELDTTVLSNPLLPLPYREESPPGPGLAKPDNGTNDLPRSSGSPGDHQNNPNNPVGKTRDEQKRRIERNRQPQQRTDLVNPQDARPMPPLENSVGADTLIIPDILFEYNSSKLNPIFLRQLNRLLQQLQNRSFLRMEVIGHTDFIGSADYNLKLSLNRAITIRDYLTSRLLIDPDLVFVTGLGATRPRDTNETADGRQRNRRVEIIIRY